jgi:hypothetical protein
MEMEFCRRRQLMQMQAMQQDEIQKQAIENKKLAYEAFCDVCTESFDNEKDFKRHAKLNACKPEKKTKTKRTKRGKSR